MTSICRSVVLVYLAALVGSVFGTVVPSLAARESGIQVTPDAKRILVNKDVDESRFVITQNRNDGGVTGNVFFTDERPPTFLYCTALGGLRFSCAGAEACPSTGRASGIQRRPDGNAILVSKDVGDARFAITQNGNDGTLTGNVFFADGRDPAFLFCQPKGGSTYSCAGSDQCADTSCPGFAFIADVTLPDDFFTMPDGCPEYAFIADITLPDDFFTPIVRANESSAEIYGELTKVGSAAGAEATLLRGVPPVTQPGAPQAIAGLEARFEGVDGATVAVPLQAGATASADGDDALIVAAVRADGSFLEGFYELPLTAGVSSELLELSFASLEKIPLVRLATRIGGVVSRYESTLVSFSLSSDTPLYGFDVRASYPAETGTFVGAADSVSCRIPSLDLGLDDPLCDSGDALGFVANNDTLAGELVLIVVNCQGDAADPFVDFPVEIVCGFAAAPGRTLALSKDIQVRVNEVVVQGPNGEIVPGDPSVLGVTTGLAVRQ